MRAGRLSGRTRPPKPITATHSENISSALGYQVSAA